MVKTFEVQGHMVLGWRGRRVAHHCGHRLADHGRRDDEAHKLYWSWGGSHPLLPSCKAWNICALGFPMITRTISHVHNCSQWSRHILR